MIETLIVDDEAAPRKGLEVLLREEPGFRVVGEAGTGAEALEAIRRLNPDLVLLDVRMPELDGFQMLERLDPEETPAVVFVTAYGDRAVDAFRVEAVDYLLKPFDRSELRRALRRVRERIGEGDLRQFADRARAVLERLGERGPEARSYPDRVAAKAGHRIRFVPTDEILWIDVADNYVRLHVADGHHLHRSTLSEMEALLDPRSFLRVNRSEMVNLECVVEAARVGDGRWDLLLTEGTVLRSSRRYSDTVTAALRTLDPTPSGSPESQQTSDRGRR